MVTGGAKTEKDYIQNELKHLQTLQKLEENKVINLCLPIWENQTEAVKKGILNLRNRRSTYGEEANKIIALGNVGLW